MTIEAFTSGTSLGWLESFGLYPGLPWIHAAYALSASPADIRAKLQPGLEDNLKTSQSQPGSGQGGGKRLAIPHELIHIFEKYNPVIMPAPKSCQGMIQSSYMLLSYHPTIQSKCIT